MDDFPKGTKWKLRAKVGDKVKWYKAIDWHGGLRWGGHRRPRHGLRR